GDCVLEAVEYPPMRLDYPALSGHWYSFASAVQCSGMSVSDSSFWPTAVKSRSTRSSCTGGPALRCLPRRFLLMALVQPLPEQIRQAVRRHIFSPAVSASSAR